jgi:uncharacterized protein (DUF433 family)
MRQEDHMTIGVDDLIARLGSGIETSPGVCGGEPRIAGTRIPVWTLEQGRQLGASEADLLRDYPGLRAADLVNAWTYVAANRDEIEAQIRENEAAPPSTLPSTVGEVMPGGTSLTRRSFRGYDRERETYERLKHELLTRAEGKYVVLVADAVEGPFESFPEARRAGYARFGPGPLYVKQVLAVEPVVEAPRIVVPCRS